MANEDGRPRPAATARAVDPNPVGRRADSRRLRPVEDAPLPQKVEKSRSLNVIRPGDAVVPAPTTELPSEWLPPKADPARPPSRRFVAEEHTPSSPPTPVEPSPTPGLVERLQKRPAIVVGAVAALGLIVTLVVGGGGPAPARSRVFTDAEQQALADLWKAQGAHTWGGVSKNGAVVAEVSRVARAVTAGFGDATDATDATDAVVVDSAASVHGFALPDGTVVVTTGLLWRLESEAELAAAIAHLAAHHRLGHVAQLLDEPPALAGRARTALATPGTARTPDDTDLLVAVATAAATAKNTGPQEREADALAEEALAAAGYDVSALGRVVLRAAAPAALGLQHPAPPLRTDPLKALPATGRVDAGRYAQEVLARLDRVRGKDATPAAQAPPGTPPPVVEVIEVVEVEPAPTPFVAPTPTAPHKTTVTTTKKKTPTKKAPPKKPTAR